MSSVSRVVRHTVRRVRNRRAINRAINSSVATMRDELIELSGKGLQP